MPKRIYLITITLLILILIFAGIPKKPSNQIVFDNQCKIEDISDYVNFFEIRIKTQAKQFRKTTKLNKANNLHQDILKLQKSGNKLIKKRSQAFSAFPSSNLKCDLTDFCEITSLENELKFIEESSKDLRKLINRGLRNLFKNGFISRKKLVKQRRLSKKSLESINIGLLDLPKSILNCSFDQLPEIPDKTISWIGVIDNFKHHIGGNPGIFTVLIDKQINHLNPDSIDIKLNLYNESGILLSKNTMYFDSNYQDYSVWRFVPQNQLIVGQKYFYSFSAKEGDLELVDDYQGLKYELIAHKVPDYAEAEYMPLGHILRVSLWVNAYYYEGLTAKIFYRMPGSDWQEKDLNFSYNYEDYDQWSNFTIDLEPKNFNTLCKDHIEIYLQANDLNGRVLKDPINSFYKYQLPHGQLNSNPRINGKSSSNTYLMDAYISNFFGLSNGIWRYKLDYESDFSNWLEHTKNYRILINKGARKYTVYTEDIHPKYGCLIENSAEIFSNNYYPLANVPENFATSVNNAILPLIPTNPTASDTSVFSSYDPNGNSVWNNNWLNNFDFSGVAWDHFEAGTLITPLHMVLAEHYRRPIGSTVTFHDKDGIAHKRTIVSGYPFQESDVIIYRLNEALPSTIKTYRIFHPMNSYNSMNEALVIYTVQNRKVFVAEVASNSPTYRRHFYAIKSNKISEIFWKQLTPGDSGSPSFIYYNDELFLTETHSASLMPPGFTGPFYSSEAVIRELHEYFDRDDSGYNFEVYYFN